MKRHGSMNHIYRLIWSHVLNAWVAVAEKSRGRGKSASRTLAAVALAIGTAGAALAAPAGGQLVSGVASIATSGATTTINQSSQNVALNWKSFNIGAQETVNFVQPTAAAIAVNRIFDTNGSQILGRLNANGQVYLINPNGILFGQGAQVNVGGMVASTLDLNDASLGGNARTFSGNGKGAIVNLGAINALDGGYVALLGNHVSNQGTISARLGSVALGAGSAATLNFSGNSLVGMQVEQGTLNNLADNGGIIRADGGMVLMSAGARDALLAGVVNNSGVIEARTVEQRAGSIILQGGAGQVNVSGKLDASAKNGAGVGGAVKVLGDKVALLAGASIDVSGTSGGGTALVGGNFHGAGSETNASYVEVAQGAVINADAIVKGNGGKVAVWADLHTDFAGSISAKGGAQSGDGGFVETSGKRTLQFTGSVDTTASHGKTGTLLLDPTNITINTNPSTGGMPASGGNFSDPANANSTLNVNTLTSALATNNVIVDTASNPGVNGAGNILVGSAISWSSGSSLTLRADNNITVFANVTNTGSGALNLHADGSINVANTVSLNGGAFEATGTAGGTSKALAFAGNSISTKGGAVAIAAKNDIATGAIDAGSGTISVIGNGTVNINGALKSTNTTFDAIIVNAGANNTAGDINGGDILVTGSGAVTVGGGGRAMLYSGSIGGSSGLTDLVGSGSLRFRYNSDKVNIHYAPSAALGAGVNAIYREQPTLTAAAITYGGALQPLTGLSNGDVLNDVSYSGSISTGGYLTAGTQHVVSSKLANDLGYLIATTGAGSMLTVNKLDLNVTGVSAANSGRTYNGGTGASLSGTAAVTGLIGDTVTLGGSASGAFASKNVGTQGITVTGNTISGGDADNYNLVQQTGLSAAIGQANLTLASGNVTKTYDGGLSAAGTATVTSGTLFTGDTLVGGSFAFVDKNAGSGKVVTATGVTVGDGLNNANYNVSYANNTASIINKANLTLASGNVTKTYDGGLSAAGAATVTSGTLFTGDTLVGGSFAFVDKNAGSGKVVTATGVTVGDGLNNANYNVSYANNTASIINKANLTLASGNVTKTYDGGLSAAGTATVTGGTLFTGDTLVGGSFAFVDKNAGSGKVVTATGVTVGDGLNNANYNVSYANNTASIINKANLTLASGNVTKTYDGGLSAAGTATVTGGTLFTGDTLVGGSFAFVDKNAGSGKVVTATGVTVGDGLNNANYNVSYANNTASIINKANLTLASGNVTKTYDGGLSAAGAATVTSGTLFTGDTLVGGSFAFVDKNAGSGKVVTATGVTVGDGLNNANYNVSYANNTASIINKANLTLASGNVTKTYDGGLSAAGTATVTGGTLFTGDTLVGGSFAFVDKNAGSGKVVTATGVTVGDGLNNANYNVSYANNTASIINKAALALNAAADAKTYSGDTVSTGAVTFAGLAGSDKVTGATQSFGSKNALGDDLSTLAVNAGYVINDGNGGANYNVTKNTAAGTINKAALVINAVTDSKTYNGDVASSGAPTFVGLVGGDMGSASQSFVSKNVLGDGLSKLKVNAGYVVNDGNGGANYSTTTTVVAGTITPATVTATASTNQVKVFGAANDPALAYSVSGLIGADVAAAVLSGNLARDAGEIAGRRAITQGSLASIDANYKLAFTAGSLLIVPRVQVEPVTVSGVSAASLPAVISLAVLNADEEGRKRRAIPAAEDTIAAAQVAIVDGGVRMPASWSAR